MDKSEDDWKPLESNPRVINQYLDQIGLDVKQFNFQDVLSVDDWAQGMVGYPVLAMVFLFPDNKELKKAAEIEEREIKANGQIVSPNVRRKFLSN